MVRGLCQNLYGCLHIWVYMKLILLYILNGMQTSLEPERQRAEKPEKHAEALDRGLKFEETERMVR